MSPSPSPLSRRRFLGQTACSALGSVSILNTLLNLKLANRAAAQASYTDYKTLVCIFLHGGNDSFNWLVPRDPARHAVYRLSRDNLALPLGSLLPLQQSSGDGHLYGLHPACPGLQEMFNGVGHDAQKRRAAWIANIGTLIEPVTKAQYLANSAPLPKALFSHSDQADQWQTSVPQGMTQMTGWAGRAADVLHSRVNQDVAMNISLSGNNVLQVGGSTSQFVVSSSGALTFTQADNGTTPLHPANLKNTTHLGMLEQQYANLLQQSYVQITKTSVDLQQFFLEQMSAYDDSAVAGYFPLHTWFGYDMRAVAKMVALRQALGLHRQTIFIGFGGWDHHSELLENHSTMLPMLDRGLTAFQRAMEALNLQDSVITFTASDFGRTLRSNGRGTDHAWGGNSLVMGGPVQGGRIYGTFPDQTLDSANDTGYGGRMIPTTSVDQLFAELLRWFGVPAADMDYVLPNVANFYDVHSSTLPLGFLRPGTWA